MNPHEPKHGLYAILSRGYGCRFGCLFVAVRKSNNDGPHGRRHRRQRDLKRRCGERQRLWHREHGSLYDRAKLGLGSQRERRYGIGICVGRDVDEWRRWVRRGR
jgi:hypothetical protein